jgi:hypothetical protein
MSKTMSIVRKSAVGLVSITAAMLAAGLIPTPWDQVANAFIAIAAYYSVSPISKHQKAVSEEHSDS